MSGSEGRRRIQRSRETQHQDNMSKAVSAPTRIVAYLPSLKTILQRLRATSATPSSINSTLMLTSSLPLNTSTTSLPSSTFSEATKPSPGPFSDALQHSHSLLATQLHSQIPLPGATGFPLESATSQPTSYSNEEETPAVKSLISDNPLGTVECMVQECPLFLQSDMMKLFPGVAVKADQLTVITLSEKTKNDMTGWSSEVEAERELLLEHFIDSAKEICSRLTGAGYWADFIDPASGRAFYSPYSNATLFETDERFRYLGFDITDLGCCKCVQHPIWGSFTFVGTIFTDALSSSPVIRTVMEL